MMALCSQKVGPVGRQEIPLEEEDVVECKLDRIQRHPEKASIGKTSTPRVLEFHIPQYTEFLSS